MECGACAIIDYKYDVNPAKNYVLTENLLIKNIKLYMHGQSKASHSDLLKLKNILSVCLSMVCTTHVLRRRRKKYKNRCAWT